MKSKITSLCFLVVLIVTSVGIGYSTYSKHYDKNLQNTPSETVEQYLGLIENGKKKKMEEYVTYTPDVFYKKKHKEVTESSTNSEYQEQINKSSDNSEKVVAEPSQIKKGTLTKVFETKEELVSRISPQDLFSQKRYLKKIIQVFEKDNQARVDVLMGSRNEEDGGGGIPTKFWLYKESDGKWRIFLMISMVVNEEYAK